MFNDEGLPMSLTEKVTTAHRLLKQTMDMYSNKQLQEFDNKAIVRMFSSIDFVLMILESSIKQGFVGIDNKSQVPDYLKHLSNEQIIEQIRKKCSKCGSDAKVSAPNKYNKGKIMIICLKCNDWVDFE